MTPRDHILLYLNGRRLEVRGDSVFSTLSDFLRHDRRLTGTKVVCAEGDCGSCTVLIGRPTSSTLRYQTVTSCIQFVYQLDNCHIITIEGLQYDGALNPLQESMVACHGAQCGFCTPGFVVSMCGILDRNPTPSDSDWRRGLCGNLCRCTGYDSILAAGKSVDTSKLRKIEILYPSTNFTFNAGPVEIRTADRILFKPTTAQDAARIKQANPTAVFVTGATDVGVQVNKSIRDPKIIISTLAIPELFAHEISSDHLSIGAAVNLSDLESLSRTHLPELARLLDVFGSPPIKNAGTLAGNIANGSPIGDTLPALFVLNAEIELTSPTARRRVNINDFYTGYRATVMAPDELITRIFIPLPKPGEIFKLYKVSKRKDLDISTFAAAIHMRLNGRIIDSIRIAYGGIAPVILRLKKTEAFLTNQLFSEDSLEEAGRIAASEIAPISDVRGSKEYRSLLGSNILRKFHAEVTV